MMTILLFHIYIYIHACLYTYARIRMWVEAIRHTYTRTCVHNGVITINDAVAIILCKRQRHWETVTIYTFLHNLTRHLTPVRLSQTQQQLKTSRRWGDRCKSDNYFKIHRRGINDSVYTNVSRSIHHQSLLPCPF